MISSSSAIMKALSFSIFLVITASLASAQKIYPTCKNIKCPKNEIFSVFSGVSCQRHCFSNTQFSGSSIIGCFTGKYCVCEKGYVRDPKTFTCISEKSCPVKGSDTTCPKNEEYSIRGAGCQPTCWSKARNIQPRCQPADGCICQAGFIRNDITGQCIRLELCKSE